MIIGMDFHQAMIVRLALERAVISRLMVRSIFIIIYSICSQLLSGYDSVVKKLAPNFHNNVPPPSSV